MARRWLIGGGAWAAVTVLLFLLLNPILAAFLAILGATLVVVAVLGSDWDKHSTFEEREAARARKRAAKWERTKGARELDRARWEAYQARKSQQP